MSILDPMCGGRMMWRDKHDPDCRFTDFRRGNFVLCDGRKFSVSPDKIVDLMKIDLEKYPNIETRDRPNLILFDPPHLRKAGRNSWLAKKYGVLPEDWRSFISRAFDVCWAYLNVRGTIVAKWNTTQIPLNDFLSCLSQPPRFGDIRPYGKGKTHWIVFYKSEYKW